MKRTITKAVEEDFIKQSEELFNRYYESTRSFRQKCEENENFWKADHWHGKNKNPNEPYPSVPALFSAIENLHAEIMDNYPEAVILPYGVNDKSMADTIGSIIEIVLERSRFAGKYRKEMLRLLKRGACCFAVMWDSTLYGGYGDIDIVPEDMRNILWDTTKDDIQKGANLFRMSYCSKEHIKTFYPDKYEQVCENESNGISCIRNDGDNILIIERWYKQYDSQSDMMRVHMARIANSVLLEWSEKDPELSTRGIYSDGKYPFVVMPLYEVEDSPVGMGLIDVLKTEQEYIDILDRIILKNAMMSGKLRLLKDNRCNIPKEKLADWDEDVLEGSDISERSIRWFQPQAISPIVSDHLNFKIDMFKRDSGQTDIVRGENSHGVTAASAILALQTAANKRTRNIVGRVYDKYVDMIHMIISRIMQFYDETRTVYIQDESGRAIQYFIPHDVALESTYDFDIKVKARKKNLYEVTYDNEIAQQLFDSGIINAVEMLEMMNFDGKEAIIKRLKQEKD